MKIIHVSFQVDHFPLLERALSSLGYEGHFKAKPDSPCIYLPANSGPDGCALFFRRDQWEVVGEVHSKVLEVFESNKMPRRLSNLKWLCRIVHHISSSRCGTCKATKWHWL